MILINVIVLTQILNGKHRLYGKTFFIENYRRSQKSLKVKIKKGIESVKHDA